MSQEAQPLIKGPMSEDVRKRLHWVSAMSRKALERHHYTQYDEKPAPPVDTLILQEMTELLTGAEDPSHPHIWPDIQEVQPVFSDVDPEVHASTVAAGNTLGAIAARTEVDPTDLYAAQDVVRAIWQATLPVLEEAA